MNQEYLDLFCYWIREREAIRLCREYGQRPWTKDQILKAHHFCNVRREDDRGTIEIREVVTRRVGIGETHMLPAVYTLARLFNSANTLDIALEHGITGVKDYRAAGNKIFHTAYLVSTCGQSIDKVDYVFWMMGKVSKLQVPRVGLQAAQEVISTIPGMGSFLSGQVVADLRNDRYLVAKDLEEHVYWATPGPGSKKGLDFIFDERHKTTDLTFGRRMAELWKALPMDIIGMNIHGQDLQNCLCEFSKYCRYRDGLKGRNRYYP